MKKYNVSLVFSADWQVDVKANSPDEAAEKAYNSEEASASVCYQCAGNINLGDCIRVIVYDESGTEVLDDGEEKKQNDALRAENERLKAEHERSEEALDRVIDKLSAKILKQDEQIKDIRSVLTKYCADHGIDVKHHCLIKLIGILNEQL